MIVKNAAITGEGEICMDGAGNRYGMNTGDIIAIQHYAGINPFKCIVLKATDDSLTVKLTKDFAVMNFLEGDPVILGFERDGNIYILGCDLHSVNSGEEVVELKIDRLEEGAERRQYERFPVSLYADIKTMDSRKKHLAIIKDISYYGMKILTKADLPPNEQFEVDIYLDKTVVFLKTNIIRKQERGNHIKYGLGILYEESNSVNYMKEFIKRLKQDQEDAVKKLKQMK